MKAGHTKHERSLLPESEAGTRHVESIMSVVATCKIQKKNILPYLTDAVKFGLKLSDRTINHAPNPAPGNRPACVGHQYAGGHTRLFGPYFQGQREAQYLSSASYRWITSGGLLFKVQKGEL